MVKVLCFPTEESKKYAKIEREASGCSWTSVQMQIVSLMVIDQVSDLEVFSEWLNNTVPVNQSETIVLMEFFLYSVKLYVNLVFNSDKLFIFENKSELGSYWKQ